MALVVPLAIAAVYASLYLSDLGLFKLKALELARYEAWGLATRPLSDFVGGSAANRLPYVQGGVSDEVTSIYADLDAANDWPLAGESKITMGAMMMPLTTANLTSTQTPLVPGIGQSGYTDELGLLGQIVATLGIGPNLDSVIGSLYEKLGFDRYGYVTGSSTLAVYLPWIANDANRSITLSQVAWQQDADLSGWLPLGGFVIGDANSGPVQTTLVADPWRLPEGFSAGPLNPQGYTLTVRRMQGGIPQMIPVIGLVLSALMGSQTLTVISRPYNAPRAAGIAMAPQVGQVDIWQLSGGVSKEPGQVTVFETGALFDDPNNLAASPYFQALNARGNAFMGCPYAERRGCQ
jgi:hypothetical protein